MLMGQGLGPGVDDELCRPGSGHQWNARCSNDDDDAAFRLARIASARVTGSLWTVTGRVDSGHRGRVDTSQ